MNEIEQQRRMQEEQRMALKDQKMDESEEELPESEPQAEVDEDDDTEMGSLPHAPMLQRSLRDVLEKPDSIKALVYVMDARDPSSFHLSLIHI